jgi:hypothetical protein
MTDAQKLKRLYIILRWYDTHAVHVLNKMEEIPEEDLKLMHELEREMLDIQRRANAVKKPKKKKK